MADLIIRRMAMPIDCHSCWMRVYCFERGIGVWGCGKGKPCPLVPLPEGHGKIVDAEEIRTRLARKLTACKPGTIEELTFSVSIDIVDHADTIVPAEGGTDDA